jgi:hypothetical protein
MAASTAMTTITTRSSTIVKAEETAFTLGSFDEVWVKAGWWFLVLVSDLLAFGLFIIIF